MNDQYTNEGEPSSQNRYTNYTHHGLNPNETSFVCDTTQGDLIEGPLYIKSERKRSSKKVLQRQSKEKSDDHAEISEYKNNEEQLQSPYRQYGQTRRTAASNNDISSKELSFTRALRNIEKDRQQQTQDVVGDSGANSNMNSPSKKDSIIVGQQRRRGIRNPEFKKDIEKLKKIKMKKS